MQPDVDWELLTRYLTGQCTPQEEQEFARWIAADEARAAFVAMMRRAWQESGNMPPRVDVDAAWQKTATRTGITERLPALQSSHHQAPVLTVINQNALASRSSWRSRLRIAAVIAGIAIGGALWRVSTQRPEPMPTFADAARTHVTQPGQRMELRLSDGTRVMLAPATILRIPENYGDRSRRVQLEGEALFEVVHDTRKPFVVHTAHGLASDLGTKFVVRAFPGDTSAMVVVAEGVVSLKQNANADSVLLVRGDLGRIMPNGRLSAEHEVTLNQYFAWTEGRLVFDDTPLERAIQELNRWYDLDIRIADPSIAKLHVTGVFTSEPASQVLQFLTVPLGVEFDRSGRTFILRKQRTQE